MSTYRIGQFEFLKIVGPPPMPSEKKVVLRRSGVDHVAIFNTGRRADPSETRTVAFAHSLQDAWAGYLAYLSLVDSGTPVELVWADILMPYKVQVLEVQPLENNPRVHVLGVGPGYTTRARLECLWRLQVVEEF